MEDRLPKRLAAIAAGIRLARHPRPLRLDALGRNDKVWMVFVGNGRYGESLGDVTTRAAMGDGELDVRVLCANDRRTWPRLLLGTAIHGLRDDPAAHIERRTSLECVRAHGVGQRGDRRRSGRHPEPVHVRRRARSVAGARPPSFGKIVKLRTICRDGWIATTCLPGSKHDGTEGELYSLDDDPLQRDNRWGDPSLASLQADLLSDMWDHLPTAHEPSLPLDAPV